MNKMENGDQHLEKDSIDSMDNVMGMMAQEIGTNNPL